MFCSFIYSLLTRISLVLNKSLFKIFKNNEKMKDFNLKIGRLRKIDGESYCELLFIHFLIYLLSQIDTKEVSERNRHILALIYLLIFILLLLKF